MANEEIIKKWLANELSEEERLEFESSEAYTEVRKLSDALQAFKAPTYNTDEEYEKLSDKVFHSHKTISLYQYLKPVLKIAALFIITLTIGYFLYNSIDPSGKQQEWIAEQSEVYLPDSSLAMVNTGSKIRFTKKTWSKERNVELQGEAFFKVKKGSRFHVKTNQGTVTVLGTQFNVKDWGGYYEVTCYSGLVKVTTKSDTILLKPTKAFRIINNKKENFNISNKPMPGWIQGESSFNSVPLKYVFAELERQYKITIETKNVELNQLFTGSFSNNNLTIALESVTIPVNLDYVMNDNKVVITLENK